MLLILIDNYKNTYYMHLSGILCFFQLKLLHHMAENIDASDRYIVCRPWLHYVQNVHSTLLSIERYEITYPNFHEAAAEVIPAQTLLGM